MRDLPCFEFRTTVVIELYRLRCPDCGVKAEKVPQLPSKAPFSKPFEDAVGLGHPPRRRAPSGGTWIDGRDFDLELHMAGFNHLFRFRFQFIDGKAGVRMTDEGVGEFDLEATFQRPI